MVVLILLALIKLYFGSWIWKQTNKWAIEDENTQNKNAKRNPKSQFRHYLANKKYNFSIVSGISTYLRLEYPVKYLLKHSFVMIWMSVSVENVAE